MPLQPSEVALCPSCEEYSALSDLHGVTIKGEGIDAVVVPEPEYDTIGKCPHCGTEIDQTHIR